MEATNTVRLGEKKLYGGGEVSGEIVASAFYGVGSDRVEVVVRTMDAYEAWSRHLGEEAYESLTSWREGEEGAGMLDVDGYGGHEYVGDGYWHAFVDGSREEFVGAIVNDIEVEGEGFCFLDLLDVMGLTHKDYVQHYNEGDYVTTLLRRLPEGMNVSLF